MNKKGRFTGNVLGRIEGMNVVRSQANECLHPWSRSLTRVASLATSIFLLAGISRVASAQSAGDHCPPDSIVAALQAAGPVAGSLWATDSIVGNLRYAPATGAGGFTQGEPPAEPCQEGSGQFTHVLTRNLAVMETEVTQGMWSTLGSVQATLPSVTFAFPGATLPAESLTWYEAVLFANLLSLQQGLTRCYYTDSSKTIPIDATNYSNNDTIFCDFTASGYRLPIEGEWEYFTRAGTTGAFSVSEPNYSTGNCYDWTAGLMPGLESVAWFNANSGWVTNPVGAKAANPWNLRDVHGNVFEWCWDWEGVYPTLPVTDYTGPASGAQRVARGGSWMSWAAYCRSGHHVGALPGFRFTITGLRLVRSIPASSVSITNIKSKTSKPGDPARISGTGFSATAKNNTVYFGDRKAKVTKAAATRLTVTIPKKCPKGQVIVRVVIGTQTSNPWPFVVK